MSCAVIYSRGGRVEAGIGSEKFLRIGILEIVKELSFWDHRRSVLIASRTSPYS